MQAHAGLNRFAAKTLLKAPATRLSRKEKWAPKSLWILIIMDAIFKPLLT